MVVDYYLSGYPNLDSFKSFGVGIWHTKEIFLRNIKRTIPLTNGIRVKYNGALEKGYWLQRRPPFWGNMGEVKYNINNENNKKTLDITIDAYNGSGEHHKFVMGHEEGHVADKTGNLIELWKAAKEEGFEFDFFTFQDATVSDISTRIVLYDKWTQEDLDKSWNKPYSEKELLAHIGGLIAIIKSKANPLFITRMYDAIKSKSDYDIGRVLEVYAKN
ncbi:MAG: hypothetical protein PVJ67_06910 [Candidatus Pacearchaeota archaeon]|jgi:hypothetical protein